MPNLDSIRLLRVANQEPATDQYGDRVGFSWNREGGNNPQISFELLDFLSTSLEITRSRPDLGGFCNFFAKSRWNLGQRCDFGSNSSYTWKTLMRFLRNLGGGLIGSIDIRF